MIGVAGSSPMLDDSSMRKELEGGNSRTCKTTRLISIAGETQKPPFKKRRTTEFNNEMPIEEPAPSNNNLTPNVSSMRQPAPSNNMLTPDVSSMGEPDPSNNCTPDVSSLTGPAPFNSYVPTEQSGPFISTPDVPSAEGPAPLVSTPRVSATQKPNPSYFTPDLSSVGGGAGPSTNLTPNVSSVEEPGPSSSCVSAGGLNEDQGRLTPAVRRQKNKQAGLPYRLIRLAERLGSVAAEPIRTFSSNVGVKQDDSTQIPLPETRPSSSIETERHLPSREPEGSLKKDDELSRIWRVLPVDGEIKKKLSGDFEWWMQRAPHDPILRNVLAEVLHVLRTVNEASIRPTIRHHIYRWAERGMKISPREDRENVPQVSWTPTWVMLLNKIINKALLYICENYALLPPETLCIQMQWDLSELVHCPDFVLPHFRNENVNKALEALMLRVRNNRYALELRSPNMVRWKSHEGSYIAPPQLLCLLICLWSRCPIFWARLPDAQKSRYVRDRKSMYCMGCGARWPLRGVTAGSDDKCGCGRTIRTMYRNVNIGKRLFTQGEYRKYSMFCLHSATQDASIMWHHRLMSPEPTDSDARWLSNFTDEGLAAFLHFLLLLPPGASDLDPSEQPCANCHFGRNDLFCRWCAARRTKDSTVIKEAVDEPTSPDPTSPPYASLVQGIVATERLRPLADNTFGWTALSALDSGNHYTADEIYRNDNDLNGTSSALDRIDRIFNNSNAHGRSVKEDDDSMADRILSDVRTADAREPPIDQNVESGNAPHRRASVTDMMSDVDPSYPQSADVDGGAAAEQEEEEFKMQQSSSSSNVASNSITNPIQTPSSLQRQNLGNNRFEQPHVAEMPAEGMFCEPCTGWIYVPGLVGDGIGPHRPPLKPIPEDEVDEDLVCSSGTSARWPLHSRPLQSLPLHMVVLHDGDQPTNYMVEIHPPIRFSRQLLNLNVTRLSAIIAHMSCITPYINHYAFLSIRTPGLTPHDPHPGTPVQITVTAYAKPEEEQHRSSPQRRASLTPQSLPYSPVFDPRGPICSGERPMNTSLYTPEGDDTQSMSLYPLSSHDSRPELDDWSVYHAGAEETPVEPTECQNWLSNSGVASQLPTTTASASVSQPTDDVAMGDEPQPAQHFDPTPADVYMRDEPASESVAATRKGLKSRADQSTPTNAGERNVRIPKRTAAQRQPRPSSQRQQPQTLQRPSAQCQPHTTSQPAPTTQRQPTQSAQRQRPQSAQCQPPQSAQRQRPQSAQHEPPQSAQCPPPQSAQRQSHPSAMYQGYPNAVYQGPPSGQRQPHPSAMYQGHPIAVYQGPPSGQRQPHPSAMYQGHPGGQRQPPPGAMYYPPPSAQRQPPPGGMYYPPPSAQRQPPPGAMYYPAPSAQRHPHPGAMYHPHPGAMYQPHPNAQYQGPPGALYPQPPSGQCPPQTRPPQSASRAPALGAHNVATKSAGSEAMCGRNGAPLSNERIPVKWMRNPVVGQCPPTVTAQHQTTTKRAQALGEFKMLKMIPGMGHPPTQSAQPGVERMQCFGTNALSMSTPVESDPSWSCTDMPRVSKVPLPSLSAQPRLKISQSVAAKISPTAGAQPVVAQVRSPRASAQLAVGKVPGVNSSGQCLVKSTQRVVPNDSMARTGAPPPAQKVLPSSAMSVESLIRKVQPSTISAGVRRVRAGPPTARGQRPKVSAEPLRRSTPLALAVKTGQITSRSAQTEVIQNESRCRRPVLPTPNVPSQVSWPLVGAGRRRPARKPQSRTNPC